MDLFKRCYTPGRFGGYFAFHSLTKAKVISRAQGKIATATNKAMIKMIGELCLEALKQKLALAWALDLSPSPSLMSNQACIVTSSKVMGTPARFKLNHVIKNTKTPLLSGHIKGPSLLPRDLMNKLATTNLPSALINRISLMSSRTIDTLETTMSQNSNPTPKLTNN